MKRKLTVISAAVGVAVLCITAFSLFYTHTICFHDWQNATCEKPMTCSVCGDTKGEPFGHKYSKATCTEAAYCYICDKTKGEPLGHDWKDATYDAPKTCAACGKTDGEPLKKPVKSVKPSSSDNSSASTSSEPEVRICLLCERQVQKSGTLYCPDHACEKSGCPNLKYETGGATYCYCKDHLCQVPGCGNIPIGGSYYCATHLNEYRE